MALYDSAKTREAAAQIKKLAQSVDGNVKPGLRSVSSCVGQLRGNAADAMEEQLVQLVRTAAGLGDELGELARKVYAYADLLEQMDAHLADEL